MNDEPYFITLDDVGVVYDEKKGSRKCALEEVQLSFRQGERVGILGKSGSGKSTLLAVIAGRLPPTSGRVLVRGFPFTKAASANHRKNLGWIQQNHPLVEELDVHKNVQSALLAGFSRTQLLLAWVLHTQRDEVNAALDLVGLADRQFAQLSELSGGERQRVAVARVFLAQPTLVLADEPTSALDPETAKGIAQLLCEESLAATPTSRTLFFCTHLFSLIQGRVDRIIGLKRGRILFDLPASEITEEHQRALYDDEYEDNTAYMVRNRLRVAG